MTVADKQLDAYIAARSLVCVRRERLGVPSLQVVPLGYSSAIVLGQYVADIRLDGLLAIRRSDITAMSSRKTDRFQRGLLVERGLIDQIEAPPAVDLSSFARMLGAQPKGALTILEREGDVDPGFWMGRYIGASGAQLRLHECTGAARWLDEVTHIDAAEITCCQLGSHYIRCYAEYFGSSGGG